MSEMVSKTRWGSEEGDMIRSNKARVIMRVRAEKRWGGWTETRARERKKEKINFVSQNWQAK